MIKVFDMHRGETNLLCNMIYSYPAVERTRRSDSQVYIYGVSGLGHRLQRPSQALLRRDYLHLNNEINDKQRNRACIAIGSGHPSFVRATTGMPSMSQFAARKLSCDRPGYAC